MLVELVLADLRSNGWLKARAAFTKFPRALNSARIVAISVFAKSVALYHAGVVVVRSVSSGLTGGTG